MDLGDIGVDDVGRIQVKRWQEGLGGGPEATQFRLLDFGLAVFQVPGLGKGAGQDDVTRPAARPGLAGIGRSELRGRRRSIPGHVG